jgi:phosphate transport system permease protein
MDKSAATIAKLIARRNRHDRLFAVFGIGCTLVCLGTLAALLGDLAIDGLTRINLDFITSFPSRFAGRAGVKSAWVGTLCVMCVTVFTAIPLGIAAAIYLEEYAGKNWFTQMLEVNLANLAGVPSIIYGLLALGLFVYQFNMGQSVAAAGFTLGILVLPIVIVTTREALRAIPATMREASYAMGATRWQTIKHHLLPYSMGGVLTGIIISVSRAIGETAPLITIGALTFIAFLPPSPVQPAAPFVNLEWTKSPFTVLPIQMFNWVSRPQAAFHANAAATGLILTFITLSLNAVAIALRYFVRRRISW